MRAQRSRQTVSPQSRTPLRRLGVAAGVLLLTGALAGCSWVKDTDDSGSTPEAGASSLPEERPRAVPQRFDADATTTFDEAGVTKMVTGKDVVLTLSAGAVVGRALPSLDVAYQLTTADGVFTDVWVDERAGDGYALEAVNEVGAGTRVGADTFTVTRFDTRSGEPLDIAAADLDQDAAGNGLPAVARLGGVVGDVVVLEAWAQGAETGRAALALDVRTDEVLWRERPARVLSVDEGVVVLSTGRPGGPGEVRAVGLRSGDTRWAALPGTTDAAGVGITDRAVLVSHRAGADAQAKVTSLSLDAGVGDAGRDVATWDWSCHPTSEPIAVCTQSGVGVLVGWDLVGNRAAWSLPAQDRFAPLVTLVAADLVYGILDTGAAVVLDALTGRDVAEDSGAAPVAVNNWGGAVLYGDRALFVPALVDADATAKPRPLPTPGQRDESTEPSGSPSRTPLPEPSDTATD